MVVETDPGLAREADHLASSLPRYDTSYARLPHVLHQAASPYGASNPKLLRINEPLLDVLGFDRRLENDDAAAIFSGNVLAPGSQPLAMAYAGHQFGGFVPQLGDGRALLLGEVIGTDGRRYDIQLKGSGQTRYSRQGDGRAALGPVLREYVVAEAMHALNIPTTRALAAVLSGDPVLREGVVPGAILTRVASSHLRVGTFEFAAIQDDPATLTALVDYAAERHPPETDHDGPPALRLLKSVIGRQASLIAKWMSVGFIHGVMNTDNCTISGETIDYGPCAFMDEYDPSQVFSSIDHMGRYAFNQQPSIGHWNMAVFAQALLPAIDADEAIAIKHAQDAVNTFPSKFAEAYISAMRPKLGLSTNDPEDPTLVKDFMSLMAKSQSDFTNTFLALATSIDDPQPVFKMLGSEADQWVGRWKKRITVEPRALETMAAANPKIIPRNHRLEAMIADAVSGDYETFKGIVDALGDPFGEPQTGEGRRLSTPPSETDRVHATFCGT
ncbi:MAG: YdiU family protein [Pseudomonadota bacterium]